MVMMLEIVFIFQDLLQPLLEVLKYSSGHTNEQHVFERTLGIFKNKLCQLREYPSCTDLNADKIHTQIKDLINLAKIGAFKFLLGLLLLKYSVCFMSIQI